MNGFELVKICGAGIGCTISYIWGGFDTMLLVLVVMTCLDVLSAFLAAAYLGKLNSKTGYRGIIKKIGIYIVVALANLLDVTLGTNIIRGAVIGFYMAMEGISILENLGKTGMKFPDTLKDALEQLANKSGATNKDN